MTRGRGGSGAEVSDFPVETGGTQQTGGLGAAAPSNNQPGVKYTVETGWTQQTGGLGAAAPSNNQPGSRWYTVETQQTCFLQQPARR